MKIGIIIYSLKIDYGGVEIRISNLTRYFQKQKGWRVEIFPLRETSWTSLVSLFLQKKHDLVVGGLHYRPYYLATLLAKLQKIKCVLIVTNPLSYELQQQKLYKRPLSKLFTTLSLKWCDQIVCVSRGVAYDLVQHFGISPSKITVIYNGVDIAAIQQRAQQPLPPQYRSLYRHNPVLIACGRLVATKNFSLLLRAFRAIKRQQPATKLVILGDGPQQKNLQQLVRQLGLANDVYFPGFVHNPYAYFRRSKLFLLTSHYEGFSNVIIEAMACGLPVVATDCPYGPREILAPARIRFPFTPTKKIINGQYGILTPLDDPDALSRSALSLLQDKTLFTHYRQASTQRAQAFSLEKMGEGYSHLISAIR